MIFKISFYNWDQILLKYYINYYCCYKIYLFSFEKANIRNLNYRTNIEYLIFFNHVIKVPLSPPCLSLSSFLFDKTKLLCKNKSDVNES